MFFGASSLRLLRVRAGRVASGLEPARVWSVRLDAPFCGLRLSPLEPGLRDCAVRLALSTGLSEAATLGLDATGVLLTVLTLFVGRLVFVGLFLLGRLVLLVEDELSRSRSLRLAMTPLHIHFDILAIFVFPFDRSAIRKADVIKVALTFLSAKAIRPLRPIDRSTVGQWNALLV